MNQTQSITPDEPIVETAEGLALWPFRPFKEAGWHFARLTVDSGNGPEAWGIVYVARDRDRFARAVRETSIDASDPRLSCATEAEIWESNGGSVGAMLQSVGIVADAHPCSFHLAYKVESGEAVGLWQNPVGEWAGAIVQFEPSRDRRTCGFCLACRSAHAFKESAAGNWVYFVQSGEGGAIKIGRTANIGERISDLQTANPEPLRLLARVRGGAAFERVLHAQFAAHRIRGEWFRPHADVLRLIAELRGG